jgi:hypothetical protein
VTIVAELAASIGVASLVSLELEIPSSVPEERRIGGAQGEPWPDLSSRPANHCSAVIQ